MKNFPSVVIEIRRFIAQSREYRKQLLENSNKLKEAVRLSWYIINEIRNQRMK
ncbi:MULTISPECIES: hypothetical protein [Dyadobacter]|uniref:hypothetical protein n=1 Tax=Dyadobacter TaxID=120831 RepID=UPI001375C6C3|nr:MULTISPECIES: hypothetical protein [Dyadobacter]